MQYGGFNVYRFNLHDFSNFEFPLSLSLPPSLSLIPYEFSVLAWFSSGEHFATLKMILYLNITQPLYFGRLFYLHNPRNTRLVGGSFDFMRFLPHFLTLFFFNLKIFCLIRKIIYFYLVGFAYFLSFFKINFYWSIADLQSCVSFCCTAKWISYMYTYIHSFLDSIPYRLLQNIEYSSLCYTVGPCFLSILYIVVCIC